MRASLSLLLASAVVPLLPLPAPAAEVCSSSQSTVAETGCVIAALKTMDQTLEKALARVAKILGFRVLVCDAREIFATGRRFPMADEVRVTWPGPVFDDRGAELGSRDAVCILTHDPKFDVPAVKGALATSVGYIGVMGSRRTHSHRLERLAEAGIDDPADLARLMSPVGLDIGARTPEETAISICAEIISARTGRAARPLRDTEGPIHR